MSRAYIPIPLRRLVIIRARGRCEFCRLHSDDSEFSHEVDHFIAIKHGGLTIAENLVFTCLKCNRRKGSDLTAIDPIDQVIVPLFNPRTQNWDEHFALVGPYFVGLTQTGRATVALLQLNDPVRVNRRKILITAGRFPD
jgi:hypothetical protein